MKLPMVLGLVALCASGQVFAEEKNGLRLTAQKTVLERDKDRDAFYAWDKVDKALGLKVSGKNISFKEMPEGTLEYKVVVRRWGHSPTLYHSYSGTEKVPPLKTGATFDLVTGKVKMGGWEIGGNRKRYQDTLEGWEIIVKHGGLETIRLTSTAEFAKVSAKAKPGPKQD
jgi:hypothetical protein